MYVSGQGNALPLRRRTSRAQESCKLPSGESPKERALVFLYITIDKSGSTYYTYVCVLGMWQVV